MPMNNLFILRNNMNEEIIFHNNDVPFILSLSKLLKGSIMWKHVFTITGETF